ncbi:hypothetical protein H1R20_g5867, partial [Candolleomyces eurysporus]
MTTLEAAPLDEKLAPQAEKQTPDPCAQTPVSAKAIFQELGILDRLLTPIILIFMVVGVIIGRYAPQIKDALDTIKFNGVSIPIAIGLIVMMWPVLTKVEYERLPKIFGSKQLWIHMGISLVLNWIVGPFLMLGLAWATLPDLPTYRVGVIMVGIARCIAMVMIWNDLAKGDANYCAILVVLNAILQIVLYSPFALLFINVLGGEQVAGIHVSYREVALSVLIYLGIPLGAGVVTRYTVWRLAGKEFLKEKFIPVFSPLALVGLLYTILVLFAYQGDNIVANARPVFRVFVPLILYFTLMWTLTFFTIWHFSCREPAEKRVFGYEMAVVQAFTASSNNFVSMLVFSY